LLLVNPTLGPATLRDFIALAKAKPGTLNYGSSGHGSTSHLVAALFVSATGINVVHVPYKGSAPAAIDIIGGQLQFQFEAVAGGIQYLKSGRLRTLGISSTKRLAALPDVPTIAEAGVPGYEATVTHGICVTAKTPPPLVTQLNRAWVAAINAPDIRERLAALGAEVVASTPEEYRTTTQAEVRRWEKVVREVAAQGT
jgi:tripartite-type tricarboxylate transporter receptor subunit TctC